MQVQGLKELTLSISTQEVVCRSTLGNRALLVAMAKAWKTV